MTAITINYLIDFKDGELLHYPVILDSRSMTHEDSVSDQAVPDWTNLDHHQCENCPLESSSVEYCPIALNLAPLLDKCSERVSHDEVVLTVTTEERSITGNTSLQRAISSLSGLLMATSSCPHMRFFRPMARFHLPLASDEETLFRAVSTYFISLYFRNKSRGQADWNINGLAEIYQNLQIVNSAMAKRLRDACQKDAAVNALILLDLFAKNIPYEVEDSLEELRYLFESDSDPAMSVKEA